MQLYDFQEKLVGDIDTAHESVRAVCAVAPTGAGKTVTFAHIAARESLFDRILIAAHRTELLDQISNALSRVHVRHSINKFNGTSVVVAGIDTISRRLNREAGGWDPGYLIIDECHHARATTWHRVIDHYSRARVLGVTATPARLDGLGLGDIFDTMVLAPDPAELMDRGFLCEADYYSIPTSASMDESHKRGGDFTYEALREFTSQFEYGNVIEHYKSIADGKRAAVFCISVAHAMAVAEIFQQAGYPSGVLHGGMSASERANVVESFRKGDLRIVTSCNVISEGFDLPAIEVVILLRPTAALVIHLQQLGRALRPMEGKNKAIVIDHVGNVHRHGFAHTARQWSLDSRVRNRESAGEAPVRVCPECFLTLPVQTKVCPGCGYEFVTTPRKPEHIDGRLVKLEGRLSGDVLHAKNDALRLLVSHARAKQMDLPGLWATGMLQGDICDPALDSILPHGILNTLRKNARR